MKMIAGLLVTIVIFGLFSTAWAEPDLSFRRLAPDALFIKTGLAESTAAFSLGASWDKTAWLWSSLPEIFTLSVDVEIGHWQTFHPRHGRAEFSQFGLTPMLRYPLPVLGNGEWFVEGGVGFHFIMPIYQTSRKRFSTSFNFQDLLGLGCRYGKERRHEVVLYYSHFSNGGIDEPNPGENFLQLRYRYHLD